MPGAASPSVTTPRWLADEMVGRLARYLRFVGYDTAYARGLSDPEVLAQAEREDRILLTRDRALAARSPRAILLTSPYLADQWKTLRERVPDLAETPQFERCTECNGRLERFVPTAGGARDPHVPWDRVERGLTLYRCRDCGHLYWEGSHTAQLRARLRAWATAGSR